MSSGPYNTAASYGSVTRALHWLTATLVLTEIPLGLFANSLPVSNDAELARVSFYFSLHKTLGVTIFFVALMRIIWALRQPRPAAMHPDRKFETFLATAVHWSLYLALVLVPLTGWISHAASSGFAPVWGPLGQNLSFVQKSDYTAQVFGNLHVLFGKVLAISLLLHLAGAVKHLLIDRDGTFARMWSGRPSGPDAAMPPNTTAPAIAALGAYTAAITLGLALTQFATAPSPPIPSSRLSDKGTSWFVQDGAIRITVRQLGSDVSGVFSDWTASIEFNPVSGTGTVDVTIAIASLSLGQVTANALGPEIFDARSHPTASFVAEIVPEDETFLANGELSLKGATVPLALPFSLRLQDGTAHMIGATTVDRRDFDIGDNYADENNVGFTVVISVELTAIRGG